MNNMGAFAYLEGSWDEAIDWYEQSLDAAERSGNILEAALTRANIAEVLTGQRKYEDAADLLAEARRVFEASKADHYMPLVGMLEARIKIGSGENAEAITQLRQLLTGSGNGPQSLWSSETRLALAEGLLKSAEPQEALEIVDTFSGDSSGGAAQPTPGVLRLRGLALAVIGHNDAAAEALRNGLEMATELGDLYEEALIREAMIELAARRGTTLAPVDLARLSELRQMLGIVALQAV
jgi:tetratricopeptide (TPR) repeat protein